MGLGRGNLGRAQGIKKIRAIGDAIKTFCGFLSSLTNRFTSGEGMSRLRLTIWVSLGGFVATKGGYLMPALLGRSGLFGNLGGNLHA